jgi:hypothetical protein
MLRTVSFTLALAGCVFLNACGNSMLPAPVAPPGSVPLSLTIRDTPPSGVAVLYFETLITGASLQPSDTTKTAVSVLATPTEVEFGHLRTNAAFLNLANVAPDTYQSITLTFGTAAMTIVNHSGAAIGTCANNATCQLSPKFNPSTATVSTAPFPITISQNSVVGVRLDFDVNASVQTDLSINPTVTLKQFTQRPDVDKDKEMDAVDELDGLVTALGTGQFTLANERTGQSSVITVDASTLFQDFDRAGCTASPADLTCVKLGQILSANLSTSGTGAMLAKRVEFEEDATKKALKGTITSVDSATQFHMVVFNEQPAIAGIVEGSPVIVSIQTGAVFQVGHEDLDEHGGMNLPGLSFASGADLLVGQDIQIRPGTVSTSGTDTTVTTALVRLWPSQISGTIGAINPSSGTFTLTGLSPLFTGATPPITTIDVVTLSLMHLQDLSGLGSLKAGSVVSVKGLLFKTAGNPTLVTRTLRQHK